MASTRKQKEALRAAILAFFSGAHYVTEEVERRQSLTVAGKTSEATESRHVMLEADYNRLIESPQTIEMFADMLDEEGLYPFESEWPREVLVTLVSKVKAPKLSLFGEETDYKFRFKKGFKALLSEFAQGLESHMQHSSTLDHWMVLLLNTSFYSGVTIAARCAENSKIYYEVIPEIEEETEPWGRYPQLANLLEKQLRRETRRRTGLVSDLDF